MPKIQIYTRLSACPWCIKAKEKLRLANFEYEEIRVGEGITRDDFIQRFWPNVLNPVPTVPQVTVDEKWIGNYEQLCAWLEVN